MEGTIKIECGDGHITKYLPKDPNNLPKDIRCPQIVDGKPCKRRTKIVEVPTTTMKEPVKIPTPVKETGYNFISHSDKSDVKEIKNLAQRIHSHTSKNGMTPHFVKYYIVYKKDNKEVMHLRIRKKSIQMHFNTKTEIKHSKIKDISLTECRGKQFKYKISGANQNDIEILETIIDNIVVPT